MCFGRQVGGKCGGLTQARYKMCSTGSCNKGRNTVMNVIMSRRYIKLEVLPQASDSIVTSLYNLHGISQPEVVPIYPLDYNYNYGSPPLMLNRITSH